MAIDSREKRFSILSFQNYWQPAVLTPAGAIGQAERQHLLHGYYGNLWDLPSDLVIEILTFNSYITTQLDFQSQIKTQEDFKSSITTQEDFQSEVH